MVTTISNGYHKMIKIVSNNHKRQIVWTVTKSPFDFRTIFYYSTVIIPIVGTRFVFRYVINIIRCAFLFSIFFVSNYQLLFLSFLIIMKGGVSKEKVEKMLRD
jgi:hypothetical protein